MAIDLPGGRTLFALLSSGDGGFDYAGRDIWFLLRELGSGWPNQSVELWPRVPRTTAPRIADPLPMLVTFRDIDNAASVTQVDPRNLQAEFGAGVRLRSIMVKQTYDPVTTGIMRRLPASDGRGFFNWDGVSNPNLPEVIHVSHFGANPN